MVRETPKSRLEILEHGIIRQTYKEGCHIDEEEARLIIAMVDELIDSESRMLIFNDMRTKVSFSREARAYFRTNTRDNTAMAFVINSKIGEIAVNFFLKFNNPTYHLRVFHDPDEAMEWLHSFVDTL